ncbi:MAG: phosphopyruvate hydratase [Lachnospiraceae bacterium]|nr:phosphopyruvate hydratase [bacterium]MDY5517330.1 phosphopyruvate hydratase [Lachnospiraceae bacterium]
MNHNKPITHIYARQILDSRGNPTLETRLSAGEVTARASVPSGASTGEHEAVELRDQEAQYLGKSVLVAATHVNDAIHKLLNGDNVFEQRKLDYRMIQLDGTENKSKLGANSILSVSLAAARTAAEVLNIPLYRYIGGCNANRMPVPMMNILNGGVHAKNHLDFQEFMIMPVGADSFHDALRIGSEIYHTLKELLAKDGLSTAVGDEGGFAPDLKDAYEVFDYLMRAVQNAGYNPGKDVVFAMDAAASELYNPDGGRYYFPGESALKKLKQPVEEVAIPDTESLSISRTTDEMINYYTDLCDRYPLVSIEDGLDENDWDGWTALTRRIGDRVQLVGDDLFVTNPARIAEGIKKGAANAVLIKVNQIGSLTEALDAIELAHRNGYRTIISHRSGETEDTFIADLAVGTGSGQIKTGAPCRSERVAKYNRLLEIEEELFDSRYINPFA